jgi:nitrate reductase NapAB chaperone NapD
MRNTMPVCSYVVIPEPGSAAAVAARLAALPGCETVRAENRDVILLVTDTSSDAEEAALRRALDATPGILTIVLAFGDLDPDAPLVQLAGRRDRDGGAA